MPHTTIDKGIEKQPITGSMLAQTKSGAKHWKFMKGIVLGTLEGLSVTKEKYASVLLCAAADFGFVEGEDAKLHFDYDGLVKDWKYILQNIENETLEFDVDNLAEDWRKVLATRVVIENGELRLQYADMAADWVYCAECIMHAEPPISSDSMITSPSSEETSSSSEQSIMHAEPPISSDRMIASPSSEEKQRKARFRRNPTRARAKKKVSASASDLSDTTASTWSSYSNGIGGSYSDGSIAVNPDAIKAAYDKLDYEQRRVFIKQMVNELSGLTPSEETDSYDDYDKSLVDIDSASIARTYDSEPQILGKLVRALSFQCRQARTISIDSDSMASTSTIDSDSKASTISIDSGSTITQAPVPPPV